MSKHRTKHRWWGYVRHVLYDYPKMVASKETDSEERAAVEAAMEEAGQTSDTVKLIKAVFFDKSHTLRGAAAQVCMSYATARRRQQHFIHCVARHLNLPGI